jgi:hypothetical protein
MLLSLKGILATYHQSSGGKILLEKKAVSGKSKGRKRSWRKGVKKSNDSRV